MTPQPYLNSETDSFANDSLLRRWPSIVNSLLEAFENAKSSASSPEAVKEAETIVGQIKGLLKELEIAGEIKPIPEGTDKDIAVYNEYLKRSPGLTWKQAPWLFSECHMYRTLQTYFESTRHWKHYDMFASAKDETFYKSADAVGTLAERYLQLSSELAEKPVDTEALRILFDEFMKSSLWGNATDLSLLVTISLDDIKALQVAAHHREGDTLLVNDQAQVWKRMTSASGGRVDIVLDNAGFEFYTDLIFALFMLDTGLAEQIVFHPKSIPWFVSDVTLRDWQQFVPLLLNGKLFPSNRKAIEAVVARVAHYEGQIVFRPSTFWTSYCSFSEINSNGANGGAQVWSDLRSSKLVFFKGDLNYRKLTGDYRWPRETPFVEALGDLDYNNINLVTLRTIKSDVCVGLPPNKEQELKKLWAEKRPDQNSNGWSWSGKYAVISYAGK
ncbi:hypothetical protein B9G98_04223 [Wickerhamiella sorbophila]|uniref:Sugar phosphate phosphatase n=1 Tax=Wickerhamiella sorbophila TaxID=45607 RepID=A0A2T0FNN6_9ASCO|nr:hypothetical protein B9G98_04223 [Wickerhamiella sorbophila]PRT56603.1 hypothetical protein B9G98_04223 [Wickerhamiella sorbophila]